METKISSATEGPPEIQISVELEAYRNAALNTKVEHVRGNTAGSTAVYKFSFWIANGHFGDSQARPTCHGMLDEGT